MDISYFHISLSKLVRELVFFQATFSNASAVNNTCEIHKNDKKWSMVFKKQKIEKTKVDLLWISDQTL